MSTKNAAKQNGTKAPFNERFSIPLGWFTLVTFFLVNFLGTIRNISTNHARRYVSLEEPVQYLFSRIWSQDVVLNALILVIYLGIVIGALVLIGRDPKSKFLFWAVSGITLLNFAIIASIFIKI